jgi:hypothetical protein
MQLLQGNLRSHLTLRCWQGTQASTLCGFDGAVGRDMCGVTDLRDVVNGRDCSVAILIIRGWCRLRGRLMFCPVPRYMIGRRLFLNPERNYKATGLKTTEMAMFTMLHAS